jgi:catechol 2,3-dioxygenase-like lactoylglutathione lyase family enzyme
MITGMHAMIFSADAAADRAFIRDVLGFAYVDEGDGWLIFKAPPSEVGVHPTDGPGQHELYLMTDDIVQTTEELRRRQVEIVDEPADRRYGIEAAIRLPGGSTLRIYEPRHRVAKDL